MNQNWWKCGVVLGALGIALSTAAAELNWPAWRGPKGDGKTAATNLPLTWSTNANVQWRIALDQPANSTPITWGNRIFLTQPGKASNARSIVAFDQQNGARLWEQSVETAAQERSHDTNPFGSSSPVTDGERVICWFGSAGLYAFDLNGRQLWRADLGEHSHQFGYGGSPVIFQENVYLNFGPGKREFVVCLDKRTGREKWRHESKTPAADDIMGTWSTPIVVEQGNSPVIISAMRGELAALNPSSGEVVWSTAAIGAQAKTSPVAGEGVVIMSGDMQSSEVAVRLGGSGDITASHVLWKKNPPKRRVGTGVIHNGRYFGIQTAGIADCIELATGKVIWEERLTGTTANNAVWGSVLLAGDRLYIMNQSGDVFVLAAADTFKLLATNSLHERSNSSIVPGDGKLFLRTHKALWCITANRENVNTR